MFVTINQKLLKIYRFLFNIKNNSKIGAIFEFKVKYLNKKGLKEEIKAMIYIPAKKKKNNELLMIH